MATAPKLVLTHEIADALRNSDTPAVQVAGVRSRGGQVGERSTIHELFLTVRDDETGRDVPVTLTVTEGWDL